MLPEKRFQPHVLKKTTFARLSAKQNAVAGK